MITLKIIQCNDKIKKKEVKDHSTLRKEYKYPLNIQKTDGEQTQELNEQGKIQ